MTVRAVLDRERVPGAAPSGPCELSGEDADVHIPHDLPPSGVRRVVDTSQGDCRSGLTERGAVIVETRVGHPDDLTAAIEAEGPVAVVPGEVRLDDPVRLRVQGVDRLDGIDEFDGRLIGERGDESAEDEPVLREEPKERDPARRQPIWPFGLARPDEVDQADRHSSIVYGPRGRRWDGRDVDPTGRKLKGRCLADRLRVPAVGSQ